MTSGKRVPPALLVMGLILATGLTACPGKTHTGPGDIKAIMIRPDLKPIGLYPSAEEEYLVMQTASPGSVNVVYTGRIQQEQMRVLTYQKLAFGDSPKVAAALTALQIQMLSIPAMEETALLDLPQAFNAESIDRMPGKGSWVVTSSDRERSNVWILAGDPPKFVTSGRTELPRNLRGRAVDDKTGLLLLTDDTNRLEFFDLGEMKSVGVITLPCREVHTDIVAANGLAWVGTREGTIVPIDIEKKAAGDVIRLGTGKGHVFLTLSGSGSHLGVAVQDLSAGRPPYPTYLKVFLVDAGTRVQVASTFFEHKSLIKDFTMLGGVETCLVATRSHLLKWDWGHPRPEHP
ncbi:MAG: hypothetical protein ABFS86_02485 [Planctomycetota bacterium]